MGNEGVPQTGEALDYLSARDEDVGLYDEHGGLSLHILVVLIVVYSQSVLVLPIESAYYSNQVAKFAGQFLVPIADQLELEEEGALRPVLGQRLSLLAQGGRQFQLQHCVEVLRVLLDVSDVEGGVGEVISDRRGFYDGLFLFLVVFQGLV